MCGIIGVYSSRPHKILPPIYSGLLALQHRGQESAGVVLSDQKTPLSKLHWRKASLDKNPVLNLFSDLKKEIPRKFYAGLGHVRYSTAGAAGGICNAQPLIKKTKFGEIALVHNGNLPHANLLKAKLARQGVSFSSDSDTEVILALIETSKKKKLEDAIVEALTIAKGAYSILLLTKDKMFAARDPYGVRPLSLAKYNGGWLVASETSAMNFIDNESTSPQIKFLREVKRGEVLIFDKNRLRSRKIPLQVRPIRCVFELIYFSRPDSLIFGHKVAEFRIKTGIHNIRHCCPKGDCVVPVPDSANHFAQGCAQESGLPLNLALLRNRYHGARTFIDPNVQKEQIRSKLIPIPDLIKGRDIILTDDSIVRGNTSSQVVQIVKKHRPRSIRFCVGSPPIIGHCPYGIDIKTEKELIAATKKDLEAVRKYLDVDTLNYLPLKDLKAIAGPGFCYGCFTQKYPF